MTGLPAPVLGEQTYLERDMRYHHQDECLDVIKWGSSKLASCLFLVAVRF